MNKCRSIPLMISRYIDGDLTTAETEMVTSHFSECTKCHRLYESYLLQKNLVNASFSERPLPVAVLSMLSPKKETSLFSRFTPTLRYGIALFLLLIVSGTFTVHLLRNVSPKEISMQPQIILESTTPSSMTTPLSSLVYYEEMAGNAVHSQFIRFSPRQHSSVSVSNCERILNSGYESPLFYDNSVLLQHYTEASNVSDN